MSLDPRPLKGTTVLNLRAAEDAPDLTAPLTALGALVIEQPAIEFVEPSDHWASFDARLVRLRPGDWIAFTSVTALRWTLRRLQQQGTSLAALHAARIAAIGSGTARALTDVGLAVHAIPSESFQSEGLLDALLRVLKSGEAVWLPRAEQGREALVEGLSRAGHPVCVTPVYRTVAAKKGSGLGSEALEEGRVHWVVFTSSAIVTHFLAHLSPSTRLRLSETRIACLGRITAKTAEAHGLRVAVIPARQDLPGLIEAMVSAQCAPTRDAGTLQP